VPTEPLANALASCGQRLFGWPTPAGLPDEAGQFLGAHSMRQRWMLVLALAENYWGTGTWPALEAASPATVREAAERLVTAMQGRAEPVTVEAILAGLGWPAEQPLGAPSRPDAAKRMARLAALAAMAPGFQSA